MIYCQLIPCLGDMAVFFYLLAFNLIYFGGKVDGKVGSDDGKTLNGFVCVCNYP